MFRANGRMHVRHLHQRPLTVYKNGVPLDRFAHPVLKLWQDYFGFSYKIEGNFSKKSKTSHKAGHGKAPSKGQRKRRRQATKDDTYMIAQMPHGIMVRRGTVRCGAAFSSALNVLSWGFF